MTLNWSDLTSWAQAAGTVPHSATYTISGTNLQRNYDSQITTVGAYLTYAGFSLSGKSVTVVLTSSPPGVPRASETRTYRIHLRAQ